MFPCAGRAHPWGEESKYGPLVELAQKQKFELERLQARVKGLETIVQRLKGKHPTPDFSQNPSTVEAAETEDAEAPEAAAAEEAAASAAAAAAAAAEAAAAGNPAAPAAVTIPEVSAPLSPRTISQFTELRQSQKFCIEAIASDHENQLKSLRIQVEALRCGAEEQAGTSAVPPINSPMPPEVGPSMPVVADAALLGNAASNGVPSIKPPEEVSLQAYQPPLQAIAAAASLEDLMDKLVRSKLDLMKPEFIRLIDKLVGQQLDKKVEELRDSLRDEFDKKVPDLPQLDSGSLAQYGSEPDSDKLNGGNSKLPVDFCMPMPKDSLALEDSFGHSSSVGVPMGRCVTLMRSVTHVLENMPEPAYEIEQNTWTSALLIGLPFIGKTSTVQATMCILVNCFVQLLFWLIINIEFTQSSMPSKEGIELWRSASHDDRNVDPITGASRVARVCGQDPSLSVANGKLDFIVNIETYTRTLPVIGLRTGPLLFSLSWLLWFLCAFKEGIQTLRFAKALLCVPRGRTVLTATGGRYTLESLHHLRLFMMLLLCMFRLFLCSALGYSGSLWLAFEPEVEDLILNASALAFIMDLDELIFIVAMSPCLQSMIAHLEPLPLTTKHHRTTCGPKLRRFISYKLGYNCIAVLIVGGAAYAYLFKNMISENLMLMDELNTSLCGGQVDFVYRSRSDSSVMLARRSTPYILGSSDAVDQRGVQQAVKQLWERTDDNQSNLAAWLAPNTNMFEAYAAVPFELLTYIPGAGSMSCDTSGRDARVGSTFVVRAIRLHTGISNGTGCSDFKPACSERSQGFLRLMCPSQCGCHLPLSGLYLKGPHMGCPTERCIASVRYKAELSSIQCTDSQWNTSGFARFWDDFGVAASGKEGGFFGHQISSGTIRHDTTGIFRPLESYVSNESNVVPLDAFHFAKWVKQVGCAVIASDVKIRFTFCFETSEVSSVTPFCPVACGCRETPDLAGCPTSCQAIDNRYEASLSQLPCEDFPRGDLLGNASRNYTSPWLPWFGNMTERFNGSYSMNLRSTWTTVLGGDFNVLPATAREWWEWMNTRGCPTEDDPQVHRYRTLCNSMFGVYDLNGLCPAMCNCQSSGGPSCPTSCHTGAVDVFGS